jgi:hypothetical protein
MAEEKAEKKKLEKKKAGVVKRVFKWVGLGILAVLIILGLVFEVPGKVVGLLLIILAACRILPKPAIKWFWAGLGVVILGCIVWVFLPDGRTGWRSYKFEKEQAALEAERAVPDEENAALIYMKLFAAEANDEASEPNFIYEKRYEPTRREPWASEDYPEMAEWLGKKEGTIAKLMEASRLEKCRFKMSPDLVFFDEHMPILANMRKWPYLLVWAGNNDIGEGRIDEGLKKYMAVLKMAGHQYQQPTMVDMLVGMALEALAMGQFNKFVVEGAATETHLRVIEDGVSEIRFDWDRDFGKIIDWEKLMAKNLFGRFYEINGEGKVRFSRDPTAEMRCCCCGKQLKEQENVQTEELLKCRWEQGYVVKRIMKAQTIMNWFCMPDTPQEAGAIIDRVYERPYQEGECSFGSKAKLPRFKLNYEYVMEQVLGTMDDAYQRVHDVYLRVARDRKGSQILIALRRFKNAAGNWPDGLKAIEPQVSAGVLVDPSNGGPFVYKLTDEGFTLYSRGKNGIDENGKYDVDYMEGKTAPDDWMIWPPRGRKAKEERKDDEQQ